MFTVLACIRGQHDLRLVVLAAVVCLAAVFSAFSFYRRSRRGSIGFRAAWLCLTGMVGGTGVWATHFIAMLAYEPQLNIHYELGGTVVSWVVAAVGVGAGFGLAGWLRGLKGRLLGGGLVGFSVSAMHFLGMGAVRMQAEVLWRPAFVVASIVIGVIVAAAALAVDTEDARPRRRLAAPVLLVLAIVAMHFTAMAATVLLPINAAPMAASLINRLVLALIVGGLIAVLFVCSASLIWVERLAQSAALRSVRASLNALPSGVAFFDRNDRLLVWNTGFEAMMLGARVDLAAGAPQSLLLCEAGLAGALPDGVVDAARLRAEIADTQSGAVAYESQLADGRWMKLETRISADGGMVFILADTTASNTYAKTLADARDQAEAANRAKSEFLANMSHEIRTPLNGVLGIAEALARTGLTARQEEMLKVVRESGQVLDALLGDILDFAGSEAGEIVLTPEPMSVADLCGSLAALFADRAQQKGLSLQTRLDAGADAPILADPRRLRQILSNLVGNAVKFTPAGSVTLAVSRSAGRLRFEVRDTGVGFDQALKDQLFQRFRQADGSATRVHGGAGLGLPLCQRLAALMDAELACHSIPGEGSTFVLEGDFPVVEMASGAGLDGEARSPRVLVVDDNAVNRQVLELILESAGVGHLAVENGLEAVEAYQSGSFDAVLMDIQMPVMDGLEATRRIRQWEAGAGRTARPIYIVSANCLPEHVAAGQAAGADGHIAKPISAAKILTAIAGGLAEAA